MSTFREPTNPGSLNEPFVYNNSPKNISQLTRNKTTPASRNNVARSNTNASNINITGSSTSISNNIRFNPNLTSNQKNIDHNTGPPNNTGFRLSGSIHNSSVTSNHNTSFLSTTKKNTSNNPDLASNNAILSNPYLNVNNPNIASSNKNIPKNSELVNSNEIRSNPYLNINNPNLTPINKNIPNSSELTDNNAILSNPYLNINKPTINPINKNTSNDSDLISDSEIRSNPYLNINNSNLTSTKKNIPDNSELINSNEIRSNPYLNINNPNLTPANEKIPKNSQLVNSNEVRSNPYLNINNSNLTSTKKTVQDSPKLYKSNTSRSIPIIIENNSNSNRNYNNPQNFDSERNARGELNINANPDPNVLQSQRLFYNKHKISPSNSHSEINLWDPFLNLLPPIGSRMAFNGVNKPSGKNMLKLLPKLDECIDQKALYPLCLFGYRQYLSNVENCEQDLDFYLDYVALAKSQKHIPEHDAEKVSRGNISSDIADNSTRNNLISTIDRNSSGAHNISRDAFNSVTLSPDSSLDDPFVTCLKHDLCRKQAQRIDLAKSHSENYQNSFKNPKNSIDTRLQMNNALDSDSIFSNYFNTNNANNYTKARKKSNNTSIGKDFDPLNLKKLTPVERIYNKYIKPDSVSEVYIPHEIKRQIQNSIEYENVKSYSVLDPAAQYIHKTMRTETYPRFLKERYSHNIQPNIAICRICLGLFFLVSAFTAEFSLVFLSIVPKKWRWLPIIGFFFGFYFLFSGTTRMDPLLLLCKNANYIGTSFQKVYSHYIISHYFAKSFKIILSSLALATLITGIFYAVPGTFFYT
ncbi:hypothetical protein AYI68_g2704 [Smittium mucronatum]|uniref:RGS domain-containing protein n=1 Tax=Smittium mucronatum TaxID=133383 RepID=A0A1R0H1Z5_9FUNG|nr:hypothetical protein AYI68_g2704 [Smittium mucronatum]